VNGIFIRLYLDEDVSVLIKRLLESRGYDVITTREAGRVGSTDAEQLAFAAEQGRAIVTHNHGDFEKIAADYSTAGRQHSGIIVASRQRAPEIARRLLTILDDITADEMRG
jgi:predicted nuclease of predicted toxin-antitoxin system